jgi:hypothetical protein
MATSTTRLSLYCSRESSQRSQQEINISELIKVSYTAVIKFRGDEKAEFLPVPVALRLHSRPTLLT